MTADVQRDFHPVGSRPCCAFPIADVQRDLAEALRSAAHVCGRDVPCPCYDWSSEQYDGAVHAMAVSAGHVDEVHGIPEAIAAALLPTVQDLIERAEYRGRAQGWANRSALAAEEVAEAEKRAAARALRDAAEACRRIGVPTQAVVFDAQAAALDPT